MTGHQVRVARAHLNWSFDDLAERLDRKVSRRALVDFEKEATEPRPATVEAIRQVFAAAGIVFDSDGVNVRLEPKARGRR